MIRSYRDRDTKSLFLNETVRRYSNIERVARRKLLMLDAARSLDELRVPPGNRLEALKADRKGQHSIRVNDQWRICFRWSAGDAWMLRLSTTTRWMLRMARTLEPIPPGEILLEEFLLPLGISQNQLARDIDIPPSRIAEIVKGRRAITVDTALRLGAYFGVSAEFWLNLQTGYDLRRMRATSWPAISRRIRNRAA